jgi:hypothetical protein
MVASFKTGENRSSSKSGPLVWFETSNTVPVQSFEAYVGMELSLVHEVESVFVISDSESGKGYTVITVINDRDPEIRARVYAREQALMDEAKGINFNFRVISRMNRNLSDILDKAGRLAFQRSG